MSLLYEVNQKRVFDRAPSSWCKHTQFREGLRTHGTHRKNAVFGKKQINILTSCCIIKDFLKFYKIEVFYIDMNIYIYTHTRIYRE